jgi:hypothetical protein
MDFLEPCGTPVTAAGRIATHDANHRQANVARLLRGVEVAPLDQALGKRVGLLLARSRSSDAIDASVVLLANDGDAILTSDSEDLRRLSAAASLNVDIVPV